MAKSEGKDLVHKVRKSIPTHRPKELTRSERIASSEDLNFLRRSYEIWTRQLVNAQNAKSRKNKPGRLDAVEDLKRCIDTVLARAVELGVASSATKVLEQWKVHQ